MLWFTPILAFVVGGSDQAAPSRQYPDDLPVIEVREDNTKILSSCRVVISPARVIADADGDGVLHIEADGVVLEFEPGSVLRGAPAETPLDALSGLGIRVAQRRDVTIRGAVISGFRVGLHATAAHGLTIERCRFDGNWAQRLRSTPAAEDTADWLWPHKNDDNQCLKSYAAAAYIEDSDGITLRANTVRRGQNGLLLDRVNNSRIYDNDCSFLSGWGVALWRSSRNTVSRNALDFCIRGYAHGVYHRGQDSAGLLMFEQCCDNLIIENSLTRSGDGIFGYAGHEATGETWLNAERARLREALGRDRVDDAVRVPEEQAALCKGKGCNRNRFIANDCSYNAIHGIELTFSFDNLIQGNRFVGNRIDGVWGGYGVRTLVIDNHFESNGVRTPRADGAGIIIECGRGNRIVGNRFIDHPTGVMLWAANPSGFDAAPWGVANAESDDQGIRRLRPLRNVVLRNQFKATATALHARNTHATALAENTFEDVEREVESPTSDPIRRSFDGRIDVPAPHPDAIGETRPVGGRDSIAGGRAAMIMTEWGPWDHTAPMLRAGAAEPGRDVYEVFGVPGRVEVAVLAGEPQVQIEQRPDGAASHVPARISISARAPGVHPYRARVMAEGLEREIGGTLVIADWTLRVFSASVDPMKDLHAWRLEGASDRAMVANARTLNLTLGYRGPSGVGLSQAITDAKLPPTNYGIIATSRIPLTKGLWQIRTRTDDGIRVFIDQKPAIERWDIHVPTTDVAMLVLDDAREVDLRVEYFQATGYAALSLEILPADE